MRFTGTLNFRDIGAGSWVLTTDDGKQYTLYINRQKFDISSFVEAQILTIDGKIQAGFSFDRTGHDGIEVFDILT